VKCMVENVRSMEAGVKPSTGVVQNCRGAIGWKRNEIPLAELKVCSPEKLAQGL